MGAEESKQREGGGSSRDQDDLEKKKSGESSSSMGSGTAALVAGAAVGAALLGVAWGASRYRSTDPDELRVGHDYDPPSSPSPESRTPNYFRMLHDPGHHDYDPPSPPCPPSPPLDYFQNLRVTNSNYLKPEITLKILSYNVCSREDYYETSERMKAIGDLVQQHSPDFVCFQEITPKIYNMFRGSTWWGHYHCSMSNEEASKKQYFCILLSKFRPVQIIKAPLGKMGRQLCVTSTKVGSNKSLVVATSHLKSPGPDPKDPSSQRYLQYTSERSLQAKEALTILQKYPNVIFCGDMNWNEKEDGKFPLPAGWVDAWTELKGKKKGYTFDTMTNDMLNGHYYLRMRLDRILCNLKGFRLDDIDIIGKEAIPDVSFGRKNKQLPVLPSDHYGLLLTICTYEDCYN